MQNKEILEKIGKLEKAMASESDPDVKARYQKKISELNAQLKKEEEKEVKEEKQMNQSVNEAEEKIKKLEKALASETDPDVKARYEKKIADLKATVKEVKEEIKEEKKEAKEEKKVMTKTKKEMKSSKPSVRKAAVKKVAAKTKKTKEKKDERKSKIKKVLSELDALIEKNKKLRAKYGSDYKGTGKPSSLERDAGRKAKPFGYRFKGKNDYRVPTQEQIKRGLKRGTIDYEARPNRADVTTKRKVKLEHGGDIDGTTFVEMKKRGGKVVGKSPEDKARFAKPAGWRWKEEAFEKGIVGRAALAKSPSKYMRDKYPDLVYYEDRLNKADKKPTRTSAASI